MKFVLLLLALCQAVFGQFGSRSGQCDIQRLAQTLNSKERCFDDIEDLLREGMRAIQRVDPTCNEGMVEVCEKCKQPVMQMKQNNDVDTQGIMECCFQGRLGGGSNRQCEFKDKEMMDGHGKHGKHGHGGGHGGRGGGRGRGGMGRGGMDGQDPEKMMQQMMTLGGMAFMTLPEYGEKMCKTMKWCKNEDRFINQRAIPIAKEYGDKITAKLFECYQPVIQVATNCTDLQFDDIECMGKGMAWSMKMKKMCMMACGPNSLSSMCNIFMQGANMGGNQQFNTNSRPANDGFYDPFSFNG